LRQLTGAKDNAVDTAAMAQLRDAVAALTAVLERVRSAPADDATADDGYVTSRKDREPDLAQELRKLLQEIETTP
jgi:hypothetical protein